MGVLALPATGGAMPRELALYEVETRGAAWTWVIEAASVFRGRVIHVTPTTVTIEVAGISAEIDALRDLLADSGLIRMSRSGPVRLDP